jgi:HD-like signal output (HDOD) protein
MLAGLIHDIGIVPILTFADKQPEILESPKDLADTVKQLRAKIGVQIIRKWDFPTDFEDVIINAENWYRKGTSDKPDYTDIVMISQLHSVIGKVDIKKCPRWISFRLIKNWSLAAWMRIKVSIFLTRQKMK